jgi:hypothetical protein
MTLLSPTPEVAGRWLGCPPCHIAFALPNQSPEINIANDNLIFEINLEHNEIRYSQYLCILFGITVEEDGDSVPSLQMHEMHLLNR